MHHRLIHRTIGICSIAFALGAQPATAGYSCGPGGKPRPQGNGCVCPPGKLSKRAGSDWVCAVPPPPVTAPPADVAPPPAVAPTPVVKLVSPHPDATNVDATTLFAVIVLRGDYDVIVLEVCSDEECHSLVDSAVVELHDGRASSHWTALPPATKLFWRARGRKGGQPPGDYTATRFFYTAGGAVNAGSTPAASGAFTADTLVPGVEATDQQSAEPKPVQQVPVPVATSPSKPPVRPGKRTSSRALRSWTENEAILTGVVGASLIANGLQSVSAGRSFANVASHSGAIYDAKRDMQGQRSNVVATTSFVGGGILLITSAALYFSEPTGPLLRSSQCCDPDAPVAGEDRMRLAGVMTAAFGGVLTTFGVGFAWHGHSLARDDSRPGTVFSIERESEGRLANQISLAGLSAGAVLLGVGATLYFYRPRTPSQQRTDRCCDRDPRGLRIAPLVSRDMSGLVVTGALP